VVLTSNNARELSDGLKRRCLHLFIDFPPPDEELARYHPPQSSRGLGAPRPDGGGGRPTHPRARAPQGALRVESLDWARSLVILNAESRSGAGRVHPDHARQAQKDLERVKAPSTRSSPTSTEAMHLTEFRELWFPSPPSVCPSWPGWSVFIEGGRCISAALGSTPRSGCSPPGAGTSTTRTRPARLLPGRHAEAAAHLLQPGEMTVETFRRAGLQGGAGLRCAEGPVRVLHLSGMCRRRPRCRAGRGIDRGRLGWKLKMTHSLPRLLPRLLRSRTGASAPSAAMAPRTSSSPPGSPSPDEPINKLWGSATAASPDPPQPAGLA